MIQAYIRFVNIIFSNFGFLSKFLNKFNSDHPQAAPHLNFVELLGLLLELNRFDSIFFVLEISANRVESDERIAGAENGNY